MGKFKKNKKKRTKRIKLSMCNNVTQQTGKRDIMVAKNTLRMIELVQEPGIAKEIFDMQRNIKLYTVICHVHDCVRCISPMIAYTGDTYDIMFEKFITGMQNEWDYYTRDFFLLKKERKKAFIQNVKVELGKYRNYSCNITPDCNFTCQMQIEN